MVPNDLKATIKEVFGDDGFMIRKDMVDNAVGYRAASITDHRSPITDHRSLDRDLPHGGGAPLKSLT